MYDCYHIQFIIPHGKQNFKWFVEKNQISHRAKALKKALEFIEKDRDEILEKQIELTLIPAPTHHEAEKAKRFLEMLEAEGISARVVDMFTIKPIDAECVTKYAEKCGNVITVEEHSVIGGLGEAVCSLLSEKLPTLVRRIGVNDEDGHSGPATDLLKQFGLSADHIVEVAKELCGK